MQNKKFLNKKAAMVDLQPFLKLDTIDEYFTKSLFFNLIKKKKHDTVSAIMRFDELNLLSFSLKTKLLNICLGVIDSITNIDEQEKLNIRKKIVTAVDNSKKLFLVMFEFFPFSTKVSLISDPGPEEEQTTLHVCGLLRETNNIAYPIEIFKSTAYCFSEKIHLKNEHLYNVIAAEFVRKVIRNKKLKYELTIELSNVEKIREIEINFIIEYLGLMTFEQIETEEKNILLVFNSTKDYDNPVSV